jgi:protein-tyrosine kinase
MGRIDEAMRRAGEPAFSETPATNGATDAFVSPWSFPEHDEATAATPAVVPARAAGVGGVEAPDSVLTGRLALFRGFDPALQGRIVSAPGAPPVLAEQFRRLAATLHHSQLVQGTKVIMITSPTPGDGKTLTATNLALTLSESYRREVLLIDADLRRPSLHEVFRVPNVAGLNDGLKRGREAKLAVLKITDTLTLLPAGKPDPDPMSSLTSERMSQILTEGASRFDWVVVDTPPLGLLTDAKLLSMMVDGALIVIRANQTAHADVEKTLEAIGRERVLGVVLNAVAGFAGAEKYTRYYNTVEGTRPAGPETSGN